MKRILISFLLLAGTCFAQGARYDNQIIQPENAVSHFLVYNTATIAICTAPANGTPCTNKATTYTDSTLGTPCSSSTQLVLAGTDTCVSGTDSYGNWGAWVAGGQYEYTVTFSDGSSSGPFPFTAGSGSATEPVDVGVTYNNAPSANLVLVRHPFPFAVTIPAGCTNSYLIAETAATSSATFTLQKCTAVGACSNFGTAVFGAAGTSATFTCSTATSFAKGNFIKLIAPASPDATLAGIGGGIYGTRAGGTQ